jgi:hypothetical protein
MVRFIIRLVCIIVNVGLLLFVISSLIKGQWQLAIFGWIGWFISTRITARILRKPKRKFV